MKQKLFLSIFAVILYLNITGCSSKQQVNSLPNEYTNLSKEKEYEDMRKKIIEENKEKWVNEGFNKAKKIVEKYAQKIKSYEVGKYALRKGYVTYPQIIPIEENGIVRIENMGCELKKELSVDEIMTIYANDSLKTGTTSSFGVSVNDGILNDSYVSSVNNEYISNNQQIESVQSFNESFEKTFQLSYRNKEQLDKYNVSYFKSGGDLTATFKNKNDYATFCQMSDICK
jgi:hypothetical protein